MLAFEKQRWKYAGSKDDAIRNLFDMSATRYYQRLGAIIDLPEAVEAEPALVNRLRRIRDQRHAARRVATPQYCPGHGQRTARLDPGAG